MSACEDKTGSQAQRRMLSIALGLNAAMFIVGLVAGLAAQSTGLIADSLDMLADATAYGIALSAVHRSGAFKARAAGVSGAMLLVLGIGVVLDAARRAVFGSAPESRIMIAVASLALLVNATVLYLLARYRDGEVHLQATWIFTRADVIANLAVILSGLIILLTSFRFVDLIVGSAIGLYVVREAVEILGKAKKAGEKASQE